MERLKAFSVEKFTLDGRKFHTLTILSAKYLLRVGPTVNTTWFVQFVQFLSGVGTYLSGTYGLSRPTFKSGTARNAFCRPTFWPQTAYCTYD